MSERGGKGSRSSTRRKTGVSALSARIWPRPKARRLRTLPFSHQAGQPARLKRDHLAYAEPGLLGELLERLRCVAASMTECLVERALDLRAMRNQNHRPTLSRENPPDVRQRRPIVIHVLDDIEADHRIEPARNLGERPSSRHPRR